MDHHPRAFHELSSRLTPLPPPSYPKPSHFTSSPLPPFPPPPCHQLDRTCGSVTFCPTARFAPSRNEKWSQSPFIPSKGDNLYPPDPARRPTTSAHSARRPTDKSLPPHSYCLTPPGYLRPSCPLQRPSGYTDLLPAKNSWQERAIFGADWTITPISHPHSGYQSGAVTESNVWLNRWNAVFTGSCSCPTPCSIWMII